MRTKRLLGVAAATAVAVVAPLSTAIAAAADVVGVGTGTVGATVLAVDVGEGGNVLSVRVLSDDGTSTTDPANGSPRSSTQITALSVGSQVVPAINLATPPVATSSSGAEDKKSVSETPAAPALSGTLAASLSSVVDSLGARSGLDGTVSNLAVAGGLLRMPSGAVTLATNAAGSHSAATRTISIPAMEVLNLGAVLEGLGLSLASLPLDVLFGLLDQLDLAIPDVADPAALVAAVNEAIDTLQASTGDLTADICAEVDAILDEVGGLAGVNDAADVLDDVADDVNDGVTDGVSDTVADITDDPGSVVDGVVGAAALPVSCDSVTGTVNDLVDQLQGVVGDLVTSVLGLLDDTSLLSVAGVEVGLAADATPSVDTSKADVTGTIGEVKVGNLTVPGVSGLDLTAAADILAAAGDTVSATVGSVLSMVDADLAGLVDVDVLDIVETVGTDAAYTKAIASVTALKATIDPSALLGAAISLSDPAGGVLDEVGAAHPALSPVVAQLEAALGGLDLLSQPTTVTVGQLHSTSSFRALAAGETPPLGELPRTGTDAAVPAIAAVLVAGVALGVRRFVLALVP